MENNSTNVNQINCKNDLISYNLDHVYCHTNDNNYISSTNNPTSTSELLSIFKENKQLKSMILLHLDLIQEQSDQILSKDKIISSLRQENDTLKQRLRVQIKLPQTRKEPEIVLKEPKILNKDFLNGNLIVDNNFSRKFQKIDKDNKQTNIKIPTTKSYEYFTAVNSSSKQKTQLLKDDSIIGESNGQVINKIVLQRITSTNKDEDIVIKVENIESNIEPIEDTNLIDTSIEIKDELIEELIDENSKNSELSVADEIFLQETNIERIKQTEISKLQRKRLIYSELFSDNSETTTSSKRKFSRGNFMTTDKPYITCGWKETDYHEDLKEDMEQEVKEKNVCLEIPTWEIKDCQKIFKMEITEDLTDDAFLKRHSKFEIDERRRKKWDVQRIREQRTIERLKRRHCKAEILESEQKQKVDSIFCSFYPTADSVKFIQITDELPVQAFGEPIPLLKPCEFSIPWLQMNSLKTGSEKSRKRRRSSNITNSPKKRGNLKSTSSSTSTSKR